ncbi:hypothetical protein WICMUC_004889 [Wickerhamomyces mucosus]|uniref:25S rRNA (uridine-N(3))-methyltransferase BMT5-like domain-containing protein n=1 Tax=Wickerhamomyces mucosus TaxID=1378264 RepID=A0A9P8PER4_9ASCO|nr:hypothetical protein WICMUC_004889 [Wickerhamomyces mucosus]
MGKRLKAKSGGKGLASALLRHQVLDKSQKKAANSEKTKEKHLPKQVRENKEIQQQINETKAFVPFEKDEYIMLIGEGDFSFALSIVKEGLIDPKHLVITSFDNSVKELTLKYPNTFPKYHHELTEIFKVKIFFKIDATNLTKTLKVTGKNITAVLGVPKLDYIIFNFPHTGRGMKDQDRNIRDHQILVLGYFKSCIELFKLFNMHANSFSKTSDLNIVSQTTSFSNEPKIVLSVFDGEPYDSWNIKSLSKTLGLKVEKSGKFTWDAFKGYKHKRTNSEQNTTKVAGERRARMYVFEKFKKQPKGKGSTDDNDDDDDDNNNNS